MRKGITYRGLMAVMLLSVYLLSPFKLYAPYLSYKINYNYISKELCENKDKPKMNCNGKCYLSKELKKASKEESSENKRLQKGVELEEVLANTEIAFNSTIISDEKKFSFFNEKSFSPSLKKFTPPPQV